MTNKKQMINRNAKFGYFLLFWRPQALFVTLCENIMIIFPPCLTGFRIHNQNIWNTIIINSKTWYSTQISVISWLKRNHTPLPCYSILSTFLFEATVLSYPHKIDIYTFIAHSFSTAHICLIYRPKIFFFFIISVNGWLFYYFLSI